MTTLNLQVGASTDDANENSATTVVTNATVLTQGSSANRPIYNGMRFTGVTIPQGTTITSATLEFNMNSTKNDSIDLDLFGHAHDNSPTFSTTNGNISGRTFTTATVDWSAANVGTGWKSKVVTSIVQEIINRAGWSSGNALSIITRTQADGSTTDYATWYAYDQSGNVSGAKLTIVYGSSAQEITLTGVAATGSVGSPTVSPGAVTVSLSGIAATGTIGSLAVTAEQTIALSGFYSNGWGSGGWGEGEWGDSNIGTLTVTLGSGDQEITLAGVASAESIGTLSVTPGAVTIALTGIASAEAVGSLTVTPGAVTITLTGIASSEALGSLSVTPGAVTISLAGLASTESFGATSADPGPVTVTLSGVASSEQVGTVALDSVYTLGLSGIASTESIGSLAVTPGAVTILLSGVAASGSVGTITVNAASGALLLVLAAPDESGVGTPINIIAELAEGDAQAAFDSAPTIRIYTIDPSTGARTVDVNTAMTAIGSAYKYVWTPTANGVYVVYVSGANSSVDYGKSAHVTVRPKFDPIALADSDVLVARH